MTRELDTPTIYEHLQQLYWGPLPFGWLLSALGTTDLTPEKQMGLKERLHKSGLVILDAHQSMYDILFTGINTIRATRPDTVIGPIAASHYYHPWYGKPLLHQLNDIPGVQVYPVFRSQDRGAQYANASGLTPDQMRGANEAYLRAVTEHATQPETVTLIAPFGSRGLNREVKDGVVKVLQNPMVTAICTATLFDWKALRFVTHFGAPLFFGPETPEAMIRETLLRTYDALGVPHPAKSGLR